MDENRVILTKGRVRLTWIEMGPMYNLDTVLARWGFTIEQVPGHCTMAIAPIGWAEHDTSHYGHNARTLYDTANRARITYTADSFTHETSGYRLHPRLRIRQAPSRPNHYLLVDAETHAILKTAQTKTGLWVWTMLRYPRRLTTQWAYWGRNPLRPWWQR